MTIEYLRQFKTAFESLPEELSGAARSCYYYIYFIPLVVKGTGCAHDLGRLAKTALSIYLQHLCISMKSFPLEQKTSSNDCDDKIAFRQYTATTTLY